MSRKQKQNRPKQKGLEKTGIPASASTESPKTPGGTERAALLKARAEALKKSGKEAEAVTLLEEALLLDSSLADVHLILALMGRMNPQLKVKMERLNAAIKPGEDLVNNYRAILGELHRQQQFPMAIVAQQELCRLLPESNTEKINLVQLLIVANQREPAAILLAELIGREPDNKFYKARFNKICAGLPFRKFEPAIKSALLTCFDNLYEFDTVQIFPAWITQVFLDPDCSGIRSVEHLTEEEDLFHWLETATAQTRNFLTERFFLDGLRLLYITNPLMEAFLTGTRKWLCINAGELAQVGHLQSFEPFLAALGQQCFLNEYMYIETAEETKAIEDLKLTENSEIPDTLRYLLISCYSNLLRTFPDKVDVFRKMATESAGLPELMKLQVFDLIDEDKLRRTIKTFGSVDDQVSRDVQAQYEENPYPRWVSVACFPPLSKEGTSFAEQRAGRLDILVAGCGTGKQALDAAAVYPTARVTAIDLSLASLAYAQRKANESGLASRLEFIQADILNMRHWKGQFDYIECSGVLHHMDDPFAGWKILTEKLKPGGLFKIALYSSIARQSLARYRDLAKELNLLPTLEGVRALRQHIMNLPATYRARNHILACNDFYTTSEARDFLFHVMEHDFTLVQIEQMLEKLGLRFAGFQLDEATLANYDKMFPEDSKRLSLENWHAFENKNPLAFKSMYQFWCRRSGA